MWVTRNKDGELRLWIMEKPERTDNTWESKLHTYYTIETTMFDNLRWEYEPEEVMIVQKARFADLMKYVGTICDGIKKMGETLKNTNKDGENI